MPLQNRVTPEGEIIATPERGMVMGNRGGRIHRDDRSLGRVRWKSKAWITCRLAFKGRHRTVMGSSYTELFFLDEATALAAGHRPCFECRRADALAYQAAWAEAADLAAPPRAAEMDRALHAERCAVAGRDALPEVRPTALPDGAVVLDREGAWLVLHGTARLWSPGGYGMSRPLGGFGLVRLLTPPSTVAVLRHGYRPAVHDSIGVALAGGGGRP